MDQEPVGVDASAGSLTMAPIAGQFKKKNRLRQENPQSMARDDCRVHVKPRDLECGYGGSFLRSPKYSPAGHRSGERTVPRLPSWRHGEKPTHKSEPWIRFAGEVENALRDRVLEDCGEPAAVLRAIEENLSGPAIAIKARRRRQPHAIDSESVRLVPSPGSAAGGERLHPSGAGRR